jgi:hypothetical protein
MSNLTPQEAAKLLTNSQLAQLILAPTNLLYKSPEVSPVYAVMQHDKSIFSWNQALEAVFHEAAQRFAVKQQEVTVEYWLDHGLDTAYIDEERCFPDKAQAQAFLRKQGFWFHDEDWYEHVGSENSWAHIVGGL